MGWLWKEGGCILGGKGRGEEERVVGGKGGRRWGSRAADEELGGLKVEECGDAKLEALGNKEINNPSQFADALISRTSLIYTYFEPPKSEFFKINNQQRIAKHLNTIKPIHVTLELSDLAIDSALFGFCAVDRMLSIWSRNYFRKIFMITF